MAAYIIGEVEITDPDGYEEYRRLVPSSIAQYGGTFLARGGKVDVLEGDWEPKRLVILEFESAERARAWWASEEYRDAKQIRQRTATSRLIVVEGV
jgi:uncharacterized protein (DUF1330 family)